MTKWRPALASQVCCLTIGIVGASLFYPILSGNRILYFGDIALYFVPMLAFQKSELLRGRIPLWNPHILCGTPFVGNPQAWPLYPSSLILFSLRPERAVAVDGVIHLGWAALGTFLFLRQRRIGWISALFAAIAWGFGGALVSKLQFPNMVQCASYLPWLLWSIDRLIDKPVTHRASVAALLVGLSLLAAHPQMFLMQFYVCLAWAIWRTAGASRPLRGRTFLFGIGALILGSALALCQLLPVVQMVRTSVRSGLTLANANRFILPPYAALYNFVAPNFYGNPATATEYVGRGNFWEPCAYCGVLAFCLAIGSAIAEFRRSPDVRFWALVALVAVWLALGRDSGLFAAAFYVIPGVSKFHDAARWLQPATFALACLAASGMDALLAGVGGVRRRALIGFLLIIINTLDLMWFVRTLNPTAEPGLFREVERFQGSRLRAYYADERRLWGRFVSYRTYDMAVPRKRADFFAAIGPNLTTMAGFDLVNGYEPVHSDRIDTELRAIGSAKGVTADSLLADAGADVVIGLDPSTDKPVVRKAPASRGRAWIGNSAINVVDVSPDQVQLLLPAQPFEGAITTGDAYAPGWTATDGDRVVPISLANGAFRSVPVRRTTSTISMTYVPTAWRLGAFVTLIASGILSIIWGSFVASRISARVFAGGQGGSTLPATTLRSSKVN